MIIDVHSHHFPDSIAVRAIAGMSHAIEGLLWPVGDGTLANHLDHLEHDGIDKAVLCQIATKPAQFEVLLRYAEAIRSGEMGARARERIIPFLSVHPDDTERLRHLDEIAARGFKGIKLHPYYQNFRLDDPQVWPMFEKIADLGLVVQCHCGYDIGYPGRYDACGPKEVAVLLRHVKNLKFIAAHLGGCDGHPVHSTDELADLGAYIDTSVLMRHWHYDEPMRIVSSWPTERILFATDFPWSSCSEAVRWVKSLRDQRDWDAVFGGNARRLLGI